MAFDGADRVVGFVGASAPAGDIGLPLLEAGRRVLAHAPDRRDTTALLDRGAEWRETAAAVARESDVLVAALPSAMELAAAFTGEDGVLEGARPGTVLVIATPCGPALARRLHEDAVAGGLRCIDVAFPESGDATLAGSVLAGGDAATVAELRPLLELVAPVVMAGPAGAAQHARIARRIARAGAALGLSEAVAYARAAGVDAGALLAASVGVIEPDAAAHLVAAIVGREYGGAPTVRDLLTDLAFALETAEPLDLDLPGVELLRMLYGEVADAGLEDAGPEALAAIWDDEEDGDDGEDGEDQGGSPELVHLTRR